jgi:hypothetical protein
MIYLLVSGYHPDQQPCQLLPRLLPILSKEDNNLQKILTNLSDVSLVYDQLEHLLSEIKHVGTIRLKNEPCIIRFKP